MELAVLVSDSLACGILPVLILRKFHVRGISEENVLSNQEVTHLLAFKPKCCGLDSPVMLFRLDLLYEMLRVSIGLILVFLRSCDVK